MTNYDEILDRLSQSTFRARFGLSEKDLDYVQRKGMDTIRRHAEDMLRDRLGDAEPKNDGKQTPMKGHPVFRAMHATACCCRGCLSKWHHIPMHQKLTDAELEWMSGLVEAWIQSQRTKSIGQRLAQAKLLVDNFDTTAGNDKIEQMISMLEESGNQIEAVLFMCKYAALNPLGFQIYAMSHGDDRRDYLDVDGLEAWAGEQGKDICDLSYDEMAVFLTEKDWVRGGL